MENGWGSSIFDAKAGFRPIGKAQANSEKKGKFSSEIISLYRKEKKNEEGDFDCNNPVVGIKGV